MKLRLQPSLAIAALLVIVGIGMWGTIQSESRGKLSDRVATAKAEGKLLFESLGSPPGATPHTPLQQEEFRKRSTSVRWSQEFAAPGAFRSTLLWYSADLPKAGWIKSESNFDPAKYAEWCKAPWSVSVEESTFSETNHRFALRLTWSARHDRCP